MRIVVDQPDGLVDTPLAMSVFGLARNATRITVQLSAVDTEGVTWESAADFGIEPGRQVDLTHEAPLSGSYTGVAPMGLFWSMKPVRAPAGDTDFVYPRMGYDATLQVIQSGRVVASQVLHRAAAATAVSEVDERPASVGFYGEYFSPSDISSRLPAVVVLGGSEGGLATLGLAQLLASHGLAVLDLAYFGEPGLPDVVSDIQLEYFSRAVAWLSRQSAVDPNRVDILGISRGAEAALLTASYLPAGVHAVVAAAPTSLVFPPQPDPRGSAWTLSGKPLPGLSSTRSGSPAVSSAQARIPVERFGGSLLLVCGEQDAVWPSCPSALSIEQSRGAASQADVVLSEPGAGHGVASLVPFISEATTGMPQSLISDWMGGTPAADGQGRAAVWPRVLAFLGR